MRSSSSSLSLLLELGVGHAVDGLAVGVEGAAALDEGSNTRSVAVDAELNELGEGGGKVLEEELLVLGVLLDPDLELGVGGEGDLESSLATAAVLYALALLTSVGSIMSFSPATVASYWKGPSHWRGSHLRVRRSL